MPSLLGSDDYTQDDRELFLKTPLDDDMLFLTSFIGQEHMSQLFVFKLCMVSKDLEIEPDDVVGKEFAIKLKKNSEDLLSLFGGDAA